MRYETRDARRPAQRSGGRRAYRDTDLWESSARLSLNVAILGLPQIRQAVAARSDDDRTGRQCNRDRNDIGGRVMSMLGRNSSCRMISILTAIAANLAGAPAPAQNLDEGKSGAQLFAGSCVDCHHSPRGLAKDRFSWTLSSYLQKHYTSSAASAQVLAAYLQSADASRANPPKSKSAAGKSRSAREAAQSAPAAAPASVAEGLLRPPAEVPAR
jgi:mono/diheme cytochrome c family protein